MSAGRLATLSSGVELGTEVHAQGGQSLRAHLAHPALRDTERRSDLAQGELLDKGQRKDPPVPFRKCFECTTQDRPEILLQQAVLDGWRERVGDHIGEVDVLAITRVGEQLVESGKPAAVQLRT